MVRIDQLTQAKIPLPGPLFWGRCSQCIDFLFLARNRVLWRGFAVWCNPRADSLPDAECFVPKTW